MENELEVSIKCQMHFDMLDLVSWLAGDDCSFSFDASTGIIKVVTKDLIDLYRRLRTYEFDGSYTLEYDGKLHDKFLNEINLEVKE
jgi:hypothetical protein